MLSKLSDRFSAWEKKQRDHLSDYEKGKFDVRLAAYVASSFWTCFSMALLHTFYDVTPKARWAHW